MTPRHAPLALARRVIGTHRVIEGWATVDLDRAAAAVAPDGGATPAPDDELLGARCLLVRRREPGGPLVLLEPSTEGLLAATLARHGEGPAVTYLLSGDDAAPRLQAAGVLLSREAGSPVGRGRLVLGGERWGPHVVAVRPDPGRAEPGDDAAAAATIGR